MTDPVETTTHTEPETTLPENPSRYDMLSFIREETDLNPDNMPQEGLNTLTAEALELLTYTSEDFEETEFDPDKKRQRREYLRINTPLAAERIPGALLEHLSYHEIQQVAALLYSPTDDGTNDWVDEASIDTIKDRLRAAGMVRKQQKPGEYILRWVLKLILHNQTEHVKTNYDSVESGFTETTEQAVRGVAKTLHDMVSGEPPRHSGLDVLHQLVKGLAEFEFNSVFSDTVNYTRLSNQLFNIKVSGSSTTTTTDDSTTDQSDESESSTDWTRPDCFLTDSISLLDVIDHRDLPEPVEDELQHIHQKTDGNPMNEKREAAHGILSIPWEDRTRSPEDHDLDALKQTLEASVYGLEDAKQAALEEAAVRNQTNGMAQRTLCLVGPPGTGKTFIAEIVAQALDRPFQTISLAGGGSAESLRGFSRTWAGSSEGEVAKRFQSIDRMDPIILLDEIEKTSSQNFQSNIEDFLLDLLDPNEPMLQDRFLDVPIDCSKTWFIATANQTDPLSAPLRDRLNIVRVDGFSDEDKRTITRDFLIPQAMEDYDADDRLRESGLLTDGAIDRLIDRTTHDDGVRSINRCLNKLIRQYYVQSERSDRTAELPVGVEAIEEFEFESDGSIGF